MVVFSRKRVPKSLVTDLWVCGAQAAQSLNCFASRFFLQALRSCFSKEGAQSFLVYKCVCQGWGDLKSPDHFLTVHMEPAEQPWAPAELTTSQTQSELRPTLPVGPGSRSFLVTLPCTQLTQRPGRSWCQPRKSEAVGLLFQIFNPADLCVWLINTRVKTRMRVIAVIMVPVGRTPSVARLQSASPLQS